MNIKTIQTSVLLMVLMTPVLAQPQHLTVPSALDCSLDGELNKRMCDLNPKDLSSPRILQEMMHLYRQQSQKEEVNVLAKSLKLEF